MPREDEMYDPGFMGVMQRLDAGFPGILDTLNANTYEQLYGMYQRQDVQGMIQFRRESGVASIGKDELMEEAERNGDKVPELYDYDGGFQDVGWGPYLARPSLNRLATEYRDAYNITDRASFMQGNGGFEILDPKEQAEEIAWNREFRRQEIQESMSQAPQVYGPISAKQSFNFGGNYIGPDSNPGGIRTPLPNGVYPSGAPRPLQPREKGRFAPNNRIEFDESRMQGVHQVIADAIRKQLLSNYDKSTIATRTGTLRKAIEQSNIDITHSDGGKKFDITVTLADLTRPPQLGRGSSGTTKDAYNKTVEFEPEEVTTAFYGPMVFYGRRAMKSINYSYLRFFIPYEQVNTSFNGWHAASNVRASEPHPEVWNLSEENMKSVYELFNTMLIQVMKFENQARGSE